VHGVVRSEADDRWPHLHRQGYHKQVQDIGAQCVLTKRQEQPSERATNGPPGKGDERDSACKEAGEDKETADPEVDLAEKLVDQPDV
jgi:hypothetical protein